MDHRVASFDTAGGMRSTDYPFSLFLADVICRTVTQGTLNINITLTVTLVRSLIRTNQTRSSPTQTVTLLPKFIIISVGRLLICIILRIAKN